VSTNTFVLLIHNPIAVTLSVYVITLAFILTYVHAKFSKANRLLRIVQQDWNSAQTSHASLLTEARDHVTKLSVSKPAKAFAITSNRPAVNVDLRHQVIAMGKKGFSTSEISRSCGLPESEVGVLLGLARLEK
jgi:hypothetical protein